MYISAIMIIRKGQDIGKGGREYRKGKQEHQEERIRMREIGMHLEERYAAMPTAADAPPLKSN